MNILMQIVQSKLQEIKALYGKYDLQTLKEMLTQSEPLDLSEPLFYQRLAEANVNRQPFFITEFKRKSPSEGWINEKADLPAQIRHYAQAGAGAISVLTDTPFFGGAYEDLKQARQVLDNGEWNLDHNTAKKIPLLLQKDFILDPLQVYLAKRYGADLILLIAAILEPDHLDMLRKIAESIGLGVLVEVHDAEELGNIQHLDFQVLGINNRDLKTFRTALNRVNVLSAGKQRKERFVIAESGVQDYRHFQMVRNADGFLIGTGLMRDKQIDSNFSLAQHFQSRGRFLFKACGIRTATMLRSLIIPSHQTAQPDFIGINFSPLSKRQADTQTCKVFKTLQVSSKSVAVFYQNAEVEIEDVLAKYPFKTVQLYAGDVSPEFVRSLQVRVILAVKMDQNRSWEDTMANFITPYAADVDCFILDGASPGSGARIEAEIPVDFPYPFLLAGGLHEENLEAILTYKNCIGVDIASGIESEGEVDLEKIGRIAQRLVALPLRHELPNRL